jgi:hypothetical protein
MSLRLSQTRSIGLRPVDRFDDDDFARCFGRLEAQFRLLTTVPMTATVRRFIVN